jgi:methylmalonyl-CoA/ethylmalonyl-CoA epimerase
MPNLTPDHRPSSNFALHHMGYLVADIDTAAQRYVDRFGYCIESKKIEDPVQTAYVQFLRLPGQSSWLELISPNSETSKLTKALSKGGGWHHICYEVSDIEQACENLRAQGMLTISPPVAATAFPGRKIAWLMDREKFLVELLEAKTGVLSLCDLQVNLKTT